MKNTCITCGHNRNCLNGTYCTLKKSYTEQCRKFECNDYKPKDNAK